MNGKLVVVFGGTGFLGKHVVVALINSGYSVKVVSRRPERGDSLKIAGPVGRLLSVYGDITKDNIDSLIEGAHAVVNLVGVQHSTSKSSLMGVNAKAAENVAQAVAKKGIDNFIHVSTMGANDGAGSSLYLRSKLLGENAVKKAISTVTIVRPGMMIGSDNYHLRIMIKMLSSFSFFPLFHCGRLQPVLVSDVAKAIAIIIDRNILGRTYDVAGEHAYSLRDIVGFLATSLSVEPRYIYLNKTTTKLLAFILNNILIRFLLSPFVDSYRPLITPDQVDTMSLDFVPNNKTANFFIDAKVPPMSVAYFLTENQWMKQ